MSYALSKYKLGLESQLVEGGPIGYLQAWPRRLTRENQEQIQLVGQGGGVGKGLIPRLPDKKTSALNHSVTLSPGVFTTDQRRHAVYF